MNILRAWSEEAARGCSRTRLFSIEGSDGFVHTLYHDEQADEWFSLGFKPGKRAR